MSTNELLANVNMGWDRLCVYAAEHNFTLNGRQYTPKEQADMLCVVTKWSATTGLLPAELVRPKASGFDSRSFWVAVATAAPGRPQAYVRKNIRKLYSSVPISGSRTPWSEEEDALVQRCGDKHGADKLLRPDWASLGKVLGRTGSACQSRYTSLQRISGGAPWSRLELARLDRAYEMFGNKWTLVARAVKTRDATQCHTKWSRAHTHPWYHPERSLRSIQEFLASVSASRPKSLDAVNWDDVQVTPPEGKDPLTDRRKYNMWIKLAKEPAKLGILDMPSQLAWLMSSWGGKGGRAK